MVILLTGGAGFIGSHLSERLLSSGHEVMCLDNFDPFYDPQIKRANIQGCLEGKGYKLVEGDIRDLSLLEKVFRENQVRRVIHLAACVGVRYSIERPLLFADVNVRGTANLLEVSARHKVSHFLFASSSSVYGASQKVPFSEDDPGDQPVSPYAATKKAGELLCHTYHHLHGLNVTCLRFFTAYGPRQRPEMAIHRFTDLIERRQAIPVFGDGRSKRDYTYISDIIDGILAALDRKAGFEILNLGDSKPVELNSLIRLLEASLQKKAKRETLPPQPGDMVMTYADISRAERMLGYKPKIGIEEGIGLFVNWYREQKRTALDSEKAEREEQ